MKMNIRSLALTFISFYIVYEPLRVLLDTADWQEAFYALKGGAELALFMSNLLYFAAYTFGAYWMFFKTYSKEKQLLSFCLLIPVALAAILLRYLMQEVLGPALYGARNYADGTSFKYYIFDNLYYAIIYLSLGTIFFFMQYAHHKEGQQRELLLQKQKAELAFLRAQLNPHFLFNILNNIYTLIYYKSDNALRSVEKLSALLRYALYEKSEKVAMKKELEQLYDFIELHKMRLSYEPALELRIAAEVFPLRIAPFMLIPFVENAFKHGNLKDPEKPLLISLQKNGADLEFIVENEKRSQQKDDIGGIGIQNIQKRLELLYGEQSSLLISETETTFKVNMKIALSVC